MTQSFTVSKDSLSTAALALSKLPQDDIAPTPALDAAAVAKVLRGSAVGGALAGADQVDTTAKNALIARFNEFAGLLQEAADQYTNSDDDAAKRIVAVSDLNSGDPHAPTPGK